MSLLIVAFSPLGENLKNHLRQEGQAQVSIPISGVEFAILGFAVICGLTDLWKGRIYNWVTFPAMIFGVLFAFATQGWGGLAEPFLGILLGLLIYGWMFVLGVMAAGDVKMLMALGSLGGMGFVLQVGLLGILVGGLFAVVFLIYRGRFASFVRNFYQFLVSLWVRELEINFPKIDHQLKMPFGAALSVAALWVLMGNPFQTLGIA